MDVFRVRLTCCCYSFLSLLCPCSLPSRLAVTVARCWPHICCWRCPRCCTSGIQSAESTFRTSCNGHQQGHLAFLRLAAPSFLSMKSRTMESIDNCNRTHIQLNRNFKSFARAASLTRFAEVNLCRPHPGTLRLRVQALPILDHDGLLHLSFWCNLKEIKACRNGGWLGSEWVTVRGRVPVCRKATGWHGAAAD